MKKSYIFASAAVLLSLAACNKEVANVQVPEMDGQTINLTLVAERGEDATKTTITYNDNFGSLESKWAAGDKIYVYSVKSGASIGTLSIDASSITNENGGATSAYATSKASFNGTVTLGTGDDIKDDFAFVYQGSGRSLEVADGLLTYPISTVTTVGELAAWDLAWAKGKIQGTASSASCAVSLGNKIGFGYFTTTSVSDASNLKAQYYESFTLDVKTGNIAGVAGEVALRDNAKFYMPLVPGTVNMGCGRTWNAGKYTEIAQENSFTAGVGFYRHGRNADPAFGPVQFVKGTEMTYDVLSEKTFKIAADKEARFTPGNLQYIGSKAGKEHWQLAPSQYSYLGSSNAKPANADTGVTFTGDLDLFGWGDVNAPFHGSTDNGEYLGGHASPAANQVLTDDHNWATKFNGSEKLYIDYNAAPQVEYSKASGKKYYVLNQTEWKYLFDNQYWGYATVELENGSKVQGIAVLPSDIATDDAAAAIIPAWRKSSANAYHSTNTSNASRYTENALSQADLDAAGALFLPAAGNRNGTSIFYVGANGYYWSSVSQSATSAYYVGFYATYFNPQLYTTRYYGFSVRLAVVSE